MRLLVDVMPYYKDDCLFSEQQWHDKEETWVSYCKLTGARCDLDEEQCSCLKAKKADEPNNLEIPTEDYCGSCNHKGCEICISNSQNPYCVPSNYEPQVEIPEYAEWKDPFNKMTDCPWK